MGLRGEPPPPPPPPVLTTRQLGLLGSSSALFASEVTTVVVPLTITERSLGASATEVAATAAVVAPARGTIIVGVGFCAGEGRWREGGAYTTCTLRPLISTIPISGLERALLAALLFCCCWEDDEGSAAVASPPPVEVPAPAAMRSAITPKGTYSSGISAPSVGVRGVALLRLSVRLA